MAGYATEMIANRDARIAQLERDLRSLAKSCETRAGSPPITASESGALTWVALEIRKAIDPEQENHVPTVPA